MDTHEIRNLKQFQIPYSHREVHIANLSPGDSQVLH